MDWADFGRFIGAFITPGAAGALREGFVRDFISGGDTGARGAQDGGVPMRDERPSGSAGDVAVAVFLPIAIALAGVGLLIVINQYPTIGPFDRATLGWAAIPLVWLAPGIGGLWVARLSAGQARLTSVVLAAAVALAVAVTLGVMVNRVGCEEVPPVEVLVRALVPGAVLGIGNAVAARVSAAMARWLEAGWGWLPAVILAAVVAAGTFFASLLAWAWMFEVGVNCAPRP